MPETVQWPEARQVFVSYSRGDVAVAGSVMAELERVGTLVWTDSAVQAGEDWVGAIERGMAGSDVYLLILSPAFLSSEFCLYELGFALRQQKAGEATIIPIMVRDIDTDSAPALLRKLQIVDGRGLRADQIVGKVLEVLGQKRLPRPLEFSQA